jgi:hypothetical protein
VDLWSCTEQLGYGGPLRSHGERPCSSPRKKRSNEGVTSRCGRVVVEYLQGPLGEVDIVNGKHKTDLFEILNFD